MGKMTKKNILLVDVGNSSVKWRLINSCSSSNLTDMLRQEYLGSISSDLFINVWDTLDKPTKVIVSCVAEKRVWHAVQQACDHLWTIQPEKILSRKEGFGIVNAYEKPSDLGSDRWSAMIGAYHEIGSDLIVVDCGSAITIDVIKSSGEHLGGYILPGLSMMKTSLLSGTADVHADLKLTKRSLTPGNSTTSCVDSAILLSVVKLIETVFKQQKKQTDKVQCVLTGGDASLVAKLLSTKYVMIPDLVLRGLAQIAIAVEHTNN